MKLWDARGLASASKEAGPGGRSRGDDAIGGDDAIRGDDAMEPAERVPASRNAVAKAQAEWLDRHGVPDAKDLRDEAAATRLTKREIDAMPIDATLDLHGLTAREAESSLASFFAAAERSGCRKVMIVHGKGLHSSSEPVLERLTRRWLERRASAGRSGHADAANGGKGATWVLLKRAGDQRSR